MAAPGRYPGILHHIERKFSSSPTDAQFVAFEYFRSDHESRHTLIFVGGLFDTIGTVAYVPGLAASLPPDWRLIEAILGSSSRQWGISTLNDDVKEIADLVAHFRGISSDSKIVLMGHSTGCQDAVHYLLSPHPGDGLARPGVDGVVLQASVSDREAIVKLTTPQQYRDLCNTSQQYVNDGKGDEIIPLKYAKHLFNGAAPISARRMISIVSPPPNHNGEVCTYYSILVVIVFPRYIMPHAQTQPDLTMTPSWQNRYESHWK